MSKKISLVVSIIMICMFFGGAAVPAAERFTDNGNGTVTDHKLGIMWSKTDNRGDIDWIQANRWVKYTFPDAIEAKYYDWRLPTLEELKSLHVRDKAYKLKRIAARK